MKEKVCFKEMVDLGKVGFNEKHFAQRKKKKMDALSFSLSTCYIVMSIERDFAS